MRLAAASRSIVVELLVLCLLLAGCVGEPVIAPVQESQQQVPASRPETPPVAAQALAEAEPASVRVKKGSGTVLYGTDDTLNAEQEDLLLSYMDLYYQSLADLQAYDPAEYFTADARTQALTRQGVWATNIAVRKAQDVDLSLTAFSYELTITGVESGDDGSLSVSARENAVQRFTGSGVDAESFSVYHRFSLTDSGGSWLLLSHTQMDMSNYLAAGRMGMGRSASGGSSGISYLETRRTELLEAHRQNKEARNRSSGSGGEPACDYDYDREAAVAYALEWAGTRNTANWPTYDRNEGNCQNYTSQCLLAGGIPMDPYGSQWKWYGSTPDSTQSTSGRSASWSSVTAFYSYAVGNSGYGLVAEADADFWSGEPGDLIQLGYEDRWRHVVIITQVVRDEDGNAVDYLIASNTADLRNYPVSAYLYPQQRLIKIHGWNG